MSEITVPVPSSPLSQQQWTQRLTDLAERAEAMIGKVSTLQAQAALATEAFGLLWPAMGPELVAGSARATLLLEVPLLLNTAPADAVQEVAERLDLIWAAAQEDPSAAVATVGQPLLELPPPEAGGPRIGRPPKVPPPADLSHQPEAELMVLSPEGCHAPVALEPEPVAVVEEEPEPEPIPEAPLSWLTTDEVAELLEVSRATVSNWRAVGRFGADGCRKRGRGLAFDPAAVEQLMQVADEPTDAAAEPCSADAIPDGLDELLNEVQARC